MAIPIHLSGRHVPVASGLERRIEARLAKLARVLPKIVEVRVVLSRERYRQVVEVTLRAKGRTLHAEASAPDLQAAVDLAMEHIDQQVRRRKERITERKPRPSRPDPKRARAGSGGVGTPPEEGPALTVRRLPAKPMSVDEALLQMEVGRRSLLVFTNATTRVVNVLRRLPDGSLELVEPAG